MRIRAALLLVLLAACALAEDDFTDIDLEPTKPGPSSSAKPPPAPGPRPPAPVVPPPPPPPRPMGLAGDLIRRYQDGRHDAFTERVYALTVCGHNLWGGDSRRAHARVARGDAFLAEGDRLWADAQRTGRRDRMPQALRCLGYAMQEYLAARNPPPLSYTWDESPKPKPFPSARPAQMHEGPGMGIERTEPEEEFRRHDEIPFEKQFRHDQQYHW